MCVITKVMDYKLWLRGEGTLLKSIQAKSSASWNNMVLTLLESKKSATDIPESCQNQIQVTLGSHIRWDSCCEAALIVKCSRCKTKKLALVVTAERNSLSQFCHNMLSIVSLRKKRPMEILESFPLFLKERGAFIWKWGTPGNDRHSLWTIWK